MAFLDNHCLNMTKLYLPQETGQQIAQYLTDTRVEPVGEWRGPARVGGIRVGGFSFALIEFGAPMEIQARIHADHFLIVSCLRGAVKLDVDGQRVTIGAGQGVIARPVRYIQAECSKDCIRFPVRNPIGRRAGAAAAFLEGRLEELLAAGQFGLLRRIPRAALGTLRPARFVFHAGQPLRSVAGFGERSCTLAIANCLSEIRDAA